MRDRRAGMVWRSRRPGGGSTGRVEANLAWTRCLRACHPFGTRDTRAPSFASRTRSRASSSLFSPPINPTAPFPHSFFALSPRFLSRSLLITTNLITDNHPPTHTPYAPFTPIYANSVRASLRTPPDRNTTSSPQHTRHTVASPRHLPPLPLDPPPTPVGSQSLRPSTRPRRTWLASRRRTPCLKLINKRGRRLLTARTHCERASRAADHLILPLPHPARLPGPSPTAPPPVLT